MKLEVLEALANERQELDQPVPYRIPVYTPVVSRRTRIGEVRVGVATKGRLAGKVLFVYLPDGYTLPDWFMEKFGERTRGNFLMEHMPHESLGGDPNAQAVVSAGLYRLGEQRGYFEESAVPSLEEISDLVRTMINEFFYVG